MNILVLVKQTFDTEEKIVIQNGQIGEDSVEFILNPYDEFAVEEAIKIKEDLGAEVTVLTVGPDRSEGVLRTALAMGADKGIFIELEEEEVDEYTLSKYIAAAIKGKEYDLILGGNMAVDSGSGQVAIRVSEELGIPQVSSITKLSLEGGKALVERDVEGDVEVVEVNLPFLATTQQGLNEPRYPSLPGIMKAKKKPIERLMIDDLELSEDDLAVRTSISDQFLPAKKQAGRIFEGEVQQQITELVQVLRTEAKIV
ncbi:electron transfer flavoprotein subunit beta/FixA family protein (plasmid) [Niallia sp. XMNu-256]|uniref:electron transfer flavoprotein subunit beta/FixA family protein n=1 Tax=Niallia sp. XMNu-256 TaxID=3082444 RepID=UPI0030D4CFAE